MIVCPRSITAFKTHKFINHKKQKTKQKTPTESFTQIWFTLLEIDSSSILIMHYVFILFFFFLIIYDLLILKHFAH